MTEMEIKSLNDEIENNAKITESDESNTKMAESDQQNNVKSEANDESSEQQFVVESNIINKREAEADDDSSSEQMDSSIKIKKEEETTAADYEDNNKEESSRMSIMNSTSDLFKILMANKLQENEPPENLQSEGSWTCEKLRFYAYFSEDDSINFRGRVAYPSKWISEVSSCQYLTESQMITLCQILV